MVEGLKGSVPFFLKTIVGNGKPIDAIIFQSHLKRMLMILAQAGGWTVTFFHDAVHYSGSSLRRAIVLTDRLAVVEELRAQGRGLPPVYLIGPDSDELAQAAESFGVTALLTCPDAWFREG